MAVLEPHKSILIINVNGVSIAKYRGCKVYWKSWPNYILSIKNSHQM